MLKKERIRLLIGAILLALMFFAIASLGWFRDEFTITYHYGFDGKYETVKVKRGYAEPLPLGRYGHVFDGWYQIDRFGNETLFDFEKTQIRGDLELTAHWKPHETVARLNANGGECEQSEIILAYGEEYTLPTPTRTGYYFIGWAGFGGDVFSSGVWTSPYADVGFTAKWSRVRPNSYVILGEYEQDGNTKNGREPIEWQVLDIIDGNYLLVSRYVIDSVKLNEEKDTSDGWAGTDLRAWLNSEFYDTVFTSEEKSLILEYTDRKLGTTDRVFLLSEKESRLLVGKDVDGVPTEYAKRKGFSGSVYTSFDEIPWWTRDKKPSFRIRISFNSGSLSGPFGLRPAILLTGEAYDKIIIKDEAGD